MKQILLGLIIMVGFAQAETRMYCWIGPDGQAMQTYTGNAKHQALMDTWMVKKCKMEKPVRQAYTNEEWKALKLEDKLTSKPLKIKRTKWTFTDPETGITTSGGDDLDYTILAESPIGNLDKDPTEVTDLNEVE